ncbi:unnamed protein product [Adineta steineri]|uniref:Tyrosine-protein kinase n=1 Tax=Adineta steineri TaxID=433720 RepID=A0A818MES0_9BILA|nr:unnamed protein product [Adineta steineri]
MDEIGNRNKKISLINLKDYSRTNSHFNSRAKSSEDLLTNKKTKCEENQSIFIDYSFINQTNLSNKEDNNSNQYDDNSILNLPYYYDNIDRVKSESILRLINRPGCFLIRKHQYSCSSLIESPYVLSIICPSLKIVHYLLYKINEKLFIKPYSQEFYHSVKDLVDIHKRNPGILPCKLLEYPIRLSLNNNDDTSLSSSSSSCSSSSSSFIIDKNKLIRQEIIGRGHFGIVYKGLYNGETHVALKTFSISCILSSDERESNILNEARTMMYLSHPYLVHLYGITRYDNQLCLVTEYISDGCLLFWLQQQQQKQLSLTSQFRHRLVNFSFQICDAMTYLESKSIIHRDLAARNCLIDDEANIVKVGDFGMARLIPSSSSSDIYEGRCDTPFPLRWSSPEVLLYREYSSKSDVWSYGILLWEIYSLGKLPYGEVNSNDLVTQLIKSGHMLSKPSLANQLIYTQIISPCWTLKPNERPAFITIKETLNRILILLTRPKPFN